MLQQLVRTKLDIKYESDDKWYESVDIRYESDDIAYESDDIKYESGNAYPQPPVDNCR